MMQLSQGQLNLLATCPRKFQHIYLEQLATPSPPEQQARLSWGSRFHLLLQQHELGLPVAAIEATQEPDYQQLQQSVAAFMQAEPQLFQREADRLRQSEHRQTLDFQGYLLTVVYDLLVLDPHQAQILDWKTYAHPPNSIQLAQNWQTRLYPFVLAETGTYAPEQISMTYWFIQPQASHQPPQSITFGYDSEQHQQTRQDLDHLLHRLSQWLDRYAQGEALPQVPESAETCPRCPFSPRCQRLEGMGVSPILPSLAEIEEVALG